MPIPFFVGVAALAAAGVGIKKTVDAHNDNEEANEVNEEANDIIEHTTEKANEAREQSNDAVKSLGNKKIFILNNSMKLFLKSFTKIKNVDFSKTEGLNELSKLKFNETELKELECLQSMATVIAGGVVSGAALGAITAFGAYGATMSFAAASTGTAISALSGVAATNATLAWLGGGALAVGGGGIAAGTAVLGGLVTAPALLVFGIIASSKAETKKDEAYCNLAKAEEYQEQMKILESLCFAIKARANMFEDLLDKLDNLFKPMIENMNNIIDKNGVDYAGYTINDKKAIAGVVSIAVAIKALLDTPILTEDGKLTKESEEKALKLKNKIRDYINSYSIKISDKDENMLVVDGKLKENFYLIKEQAENGNGTAMYLLAQYFKIYGTDEEYKVWLSKAVLANNILAKVKWHLEYEEEINKVLLKRVIEMAEADNIFACFELGKYYDERQNYVEAVKWYRKAAEQGYSVAQCNLAATYLDGKGKEKNYEEAVKWYRKAAEQGNPLAQNMLGNMYSQGKGVAQSYIEAVKWYRKAAEQNYTLAQAALGLYYKTGLGVHIDFNEAAKWLYKAAEQGNAIAQSNLGSMYFNGEGIEQSNYKAAKWQKKAAEQGYAPAQNILALMTLQGVGTERDVAKAMDLFMKAAKQDYVDAQFYIGGIYFNGVGVEKNYVEAVKWYRKAAEQNHVQAQYNLGCMTLVGVGVKRDDKEGLMWIKKAATQGHVEAQNFLIKMS